MLMKSITVGARVGHWAAEQSAAAEIPFCTGRFCGKPTWHLRKWPNPNVISNCIKCLPPWAPPPTRGGRFQRSSTSGQLTAVVFRWCRCSVWDRFDWFTYNRRQIVAVLDCKLAWASAQPPANHDRIHRIALRSRPLATPLTRLSFSHRVRVPSFSIVLFTTSPSCMCSGAKPVLMSLLNCKLTGVQLS